MDPPRAARAARPRNPPRAAAGTRRGRRGTALPRTAGCGEHHRQAPIGLAAGRRDHAIDDLLLQHEMHVGDVRRALEQAEQERRRDVVRQVAADAQRRSAAVQCREIDVEHVGLVHDAARRPPSRSARSARIRSRSISMTSSALAALERAGKVSAPRPGPISTTRSPGFGSIAATIRARTPGSCRKCWPKRLRARMHARGSATAPPGAGGEPDRLEQAAWVRAAGARRDRAPCRDRRSALESAGRASR